MNRLQKKCIIAAAASHGLLVLILVVGPAFFSSPEKFESTQLITMISPNVVDNARSSGGNPNIKSTPAPPPPAPAPVEPTHAEVPKPVDPPKIKVARTKEIEPTEKVKSVEHSDEPDLVPKKHKVVLTSDDLKLSKPKATKTKTAKNTDDSESKAQADAEARQRANMMGRVLKSLTSNLSSSTAVEMPGPGGSELMASNYRDIVASKYTLAWSPPVNLEDETATVVVSVTISRNGEVISHRITKPSGNPGMDKSIENTLDNVTFIEPFPENSKDQQRSFTIKFNLATKRSIG